MKVFDRPPTDERALAAAFEPEPAPAAEEPADIEAPPEPTPETGDSQAETRARFGSDAAAARRLIGSGQLDEAARSLEALESAARSLGPPQHQMVHELSFRLAEAKKDGKAARAALERWLLSCGPDRVNGCRSDKVLYDKAIKDIEKGRYEVARLTLNTLINTYDTSEYLAKSKLAESGWAKKGAEQIREADDCLQKAEAPSRARSPSPRCLELAMGIYKRFGDRLQIARVHLARGLTAGSDAEAAPHFIRAEKACDEPRCLSVRRRALKLLGWNRVRQGDLAGAARSMLADMRLFASTLPPERRAFGRTREVDQVCALLDAREGQGSCRRIERAENGGYTFRDFSQERVGEGLPEDKVRLVNEHFGVLMQDCLQREAARLSPPASARYEVHWMVTNDGRVDQVRMGRKDHDTSPFADCVRKQFAMWRYPRYSGERQHVEQVFTVNARQTFQW